MYALTAQSRLTLCDPMDHSPLGSSVHWILQARIMVCIAFPFSRGSSQLRDWTRVSCIAGKLYHLSHQGCPLDNLMLLKCFYNPNQSTNSILAPIKSQRHFFFFNKNRGEKPALKFIRNNKNFRIAKVILRKNKTEDITLPDFKIHCKVIITITIWYWHKHI